MEYWNSANVEDVEIVKAVQVVSTDYSDSKDYNTYDRDIIICVNQRNLRITISFSQ
jgi:hypothetical protein